MGTLEGFCGAVCDASDSDRLRPEIALYLGYIGGSFGASHFIGFPYFPQMKYQTCQKRTYNEPWRPPQGTQIGARCGPITGNR